MNNGLPVMTNRALINRGGGGGGALPYWVARDVQFFGALFFSNNY